VIRRHVIVHGRVQGVYFRDSLRRHAYLVGVTGWARNTRDGTVEAIFEGPADAVERMLEKCRTGPPDACVDRIEVWDEEPEGLGGFAIR
jgi:acylphosphatase